MHSDSNALAAELQGLTAAEDAQTRLFLETGMHVEGLRIAAAGHGLEIDDVADHIFFSVASELASSKLAGEEPRKAERNILASFAVLEVPEPIVQAVLAYRPMEPLTETDKPLVAAITAQNKMFEQRNRIIDDEIDEALLSLAGITESTPMEHKVLRFLARYCYELRHKTDDQKKNQRRAEVLENLNVAIDNLGCRPTLRRVIATLLNKS